MKVLHSGSLDVNSGGPAMSTYNTLWGLLNLGVNTQVIMYPLSKNGRLRGTDIPVHIAKAPIERKLLFCLSYKD